MSLSEEDKFNEAWRSAFDDQAENPSDGLWEAIERRLDEEDKGRVIPIWPRFRPWAYGAAAAILTIVLGWWATESIETMQNNRPVAGQTARPSGAESAQVPNTKENTGETPAGITASPSASSAPADRPGRLSDETVAARRLPSRRKTTTGPETNPELESSQTAGTIDQLIKDRSVLSGKRVSPAPEILKSQEALVANPQGSRPANRPDQPQVSFSAPSAARTGEPSPIPAGGNPAEPAEERLAFDADLLKGKAIQGRRYTQVDRIVWYRAPETAVEPQIKERARKEYWAGLTATPTSFNPMASVGLVGQSNYGLAYVSSNSVQQGRFQQEGSTVQNKARISMAWQAGGGVHLSRHWSVETGVQYLNGRSQAISNSAVANAFTNQPENLLVNAVRNSSPTVAQADVQKNMNTNFLPTSSDGTSTLVNPGFAAVVPEEQSVSNNFQYLQIPVQLGYHILPDNKLSYAILAGVMANVFLQNTINGTVEVTPSDQVYRQMVMAGTAGLRINYHPTRHWSGSLTGSYQQALQNGTVSNAQLQVQPQAIGVGFGLNYHF
ncbi:anti-sigma factor [Larkinella soli]|uniref:anti-sigma factor n=1 Tax=Larkinella soli TaxID=1770527 RepID=UPI000FFBFFD4|nr:anti-sigma factor [Larkinella soli]